LNYFGYNVGTVDGSIGRNTRNGIARYQSDMGFHADGRMDNYERDFLLNSQQRAQASVNVAPYNAVLASQGRGGLLRTFRNEQLGIAPVVPAVAPAPVPVPVPAPVATKSVPAIADTAALPQFTFGQSDRSISGYCNQINALTAANGGVTSAARVIDAEFALSEQFCLARTHAIADSANIEATIPNLNSAEIEAQCEGLTQAISPHLATLGTARPESVTSSTLTFMQGSGQPMDRLISGGKVCLGIGYRTDNAEMALASAVLLTSGGQRGYGEIVSHQMREGFGAARSTPQQAGEWMTLALNAMTSGGPIVLGQSADRVAVLSAAM
jgi:peptidoglycan hydrolase-like protein with peptidoglycan-binding domain